MHKQHDYINELREVVRNATYQHGSRAKLAEAIGVTPQRINDFLKGNRSLTPDNLQAMANAVGYTIRVMKD